jgi:putative phosphoesterase
MRVAAIYDVHSNLPALEAVLHDIREARVDQVVVGGDVVPGPMPSEAMTRLLELKVPVHFIRGNGDREVLSRMMGEDTGTVPEKFREVIDWVAQQLSTEHEEALAGWPQTYTVQISELGEVLFCHATPRNDTEVFTRLTPEDRLMKVFAGLDVTAVVCGHTHMQFDRMIGGIRVLNAGSVGMPYGKPGAYWLLLGPGIELRHTPYDLEKAARRIRGTGYPHAEDFAANNILQPASEAETLELFTRVELK